MPAAKQTKQDAEDTVSIRVDIGVLKNKVDSVQTDVKDLSTKFDKQDNIKRKDLIEFRETLVGRMTDMQRDFQRQLDDKADASSVADLKKVVAAAGTFFLTLIGGVILFYVTHKG